MLVATIAAYYGNVCDERNKVYESMVRLESRV